MLRSEGHSDIGKGGKAQLDDVLEITTIFLLLGIGTMCFSILGKSFSKQVLSRP